MSGDPIFIEIDEKPWKGHLDNIEAWLGEVPTTQATFRQLLEDAGPKLQEPHFRKFVAEVAETARHHERRAEDFYKMIGRDPSAARKLAGPARPGPARPWPAPASSASRPRIRPGAPRGPGEGSTPSSPRASTALPTVARYATRDHHARIRREANTTALSLSPGASGDFGEFDA